jgi:LCP family protein required for cell wall assembly
MSTTTPDWRAGSGRASVPGQEQQQPDPGRLVGRASVPVASPEPELAPPPSQPYGGQSYGRPPRDGAPALVAKTKRRKPRWRKVLLGIGLAVLLLVGLGWFYVRSLDDNMRRIEVFAPITGERPTNSTGSFNILLLGSDSRNPDAIETDDTYRADTIMLMHVPSGGGGAYMISIPRDLWVPIPDNGEAKINAATAFGGVPLMVQTVESYTGVRVDEVMLVDFGGFVEVTDAVGGVDMRIEETITSIHGDKRVFEEGDQHLNGEEALDYIRQRYQFADGDFTRMRNQQQFLRSLMGEATGGSTLRNPGKLNAFLQAATGTLTVDEDFSLFNVGWKLRGVRGSNLTFLVSPHSGTGNIAGQSVVVPDDAGAEDLYAAVRADRMSQWATDNPDRVGD